jgi:hypothetical protein
MIKRYLCLNLELIALRAGLSAGRCDTASFLEKRLVFANSNPPSGGSGGGAEAEKEKLTLDNIRGRLDQMEEEKKLSKDAVTAASAALRTGSDIIKMRILKAARKVEDGTYTEKDFLERFAETAEKEAEIKTADKEEKAKSAEGKETEVEKEKTNPQIEGIQMAVSEKISRMIETTGKLREQLKNPGTSKAEALPDAEKIVSKLKELDGKDKETGKKVKAVLQKLMKMKKLTKDEADDIFSLDVSDPDYAIKFRELTRELDDAVDSKIIEELKQAKREEEKEIIALEKEMAETTKLFRRLMESLSDQVYRRAEREKAIIERSRASGIPLKPGQVVVFQGPFGENRKKNLQYKKAYGKIKDITFDDTQITFDAQGKPVSSIASNEPMIVVEVVDPETNRMVESKLAFSSFMQWVDRTNVTEDLKWPKDLEDSIGESVKAGDTFEYRRINDAGDKNSAEDVQVTVVGFDNGRDEYGDSTKVIKLDQPVVVCPSSGETKDTLTLGEFAKWFKREDAMKSIGSIEELRGKLKDFNKKLNKQYNRNADHFPPIEVKEGEILKYDDNSGSSWIIQEVTDKTVKLGDGTTRTFASFYRWVENNNVEKVDSNAAAEEAASQMEEGEDKEALKNKVKHDIEAANAKLIEDSKDPAKAAAHGHSEDGSQFTKSYLRQLWNDTSFISAKSLWEVGKTIVEFVKRKLARREKGVVGVVGEKMFGPMYAELGAEFKSLAQSAENEEVQHHTKVYETMGIDFLKHELHIARNKDILKAAITVLCNKGQMRWDDPEFHKALNRLTNGEPTFVHEKTHLSDIEKVIDGWWGQDSFKEFRLKQDGQYKSTMSGFEDRAKRLESDPDRNGGLRGALKRLLYRHLQGEYVNPCEFEEYLRYAIGAGKITFEDKLFFFIMGIGAVGKGKHGHHGETLLHVDRTGAIESDLLKAFPILDYFASREDFPDYNDDGTEKYETDAAGNIKKDEHGNPIRATGKITIQHFRHWIKDIMKEDLKVKSLEDITDPDKLKPGAFMSRLLNEEIVWEETARKRIEKAAGNVSNWDHDDFNIFGVMLGEESVVNLVLRQGGSEQKVTNAGLKNTYVGFNNFTKVKMEMLRRHLKEGNAPQADKDVRDLMNLWRAFIRFDALLENRFKPDGGVVVHFGDLEYDSYAVCDGSRIVRRQQKEVQAFIGGIANAMNLTNEWGVVTNRVISKDDTGAQQSEIAVFGGKLEGRLKNLKPKEMLELFDNIQKENAKIGLNVQGTINPQDVNKSQKEKQAAEDIQLKEYKNLKIEEKVRKIDQLEQELAVISARPAEEIQKEKDVRLDKVLQMAKAGDFTRIDEKSDLELLERRIGELTAKKNKLESGGGTTTQKAA